MVLSRMLQLTVAEYIPAETGTHIRHYCASFNSVLAEFAVAQSSVGYSLGLITLLWRECPDSCGRGFVAAEQRPLDLAMLRSIPAYFSCIRWLLRCKRWSPDVRPAWRPSRQEFAAGLAILVPLVLG